MLAQAYNHSTVETEAEGMPNFWGQTRHSEFQVIAEWEYVPYTFIPNSWAVVAQKTEAEGTVVTRPVILKIKKHWGKNLDERKLDHLLFYSSSPHEQTQKSSDHSLASQIQQDRHFFHDNYTGLIVQESPNCNTAHQLQKKKDW